MNKMKTAGAEFAASIAEAGFVFDMIDAQIYFKGKSRPIDEALEMLTDEWIDDGAYCAQTVIDLRDALKFYRDLAFAMHDKTQLLEKEKEDLKMELSAAKLEAWNLQNEINADYYPPA
jgi:hypothetical protein